MRIRLFILLAIIFLSCKKPYQPAVIAAANSYLVIEGNINTGNDSTIIKLSHTVKLDTTIGSKPESHASVTIESDTHSFYPLYEIKTGIYAARALNLSVSQQYRLNVSTSDGKKYQSDFVEAKQSPPIDSVNYIVKNNGVQINVSTHDLSDRTRYYRWEYSETWMFHSAFQSFAMLVHVPKDTIVYRTYDNQIYTCWANARSSTILLGSSAKLQHDVIASAPVTFVSGYAERLSNRYSILVKQYAITKDAFNYWQQLEKNTEKLGSIFDAQPSEIPGNIHCLSNPSEPVFGFISAGSTTEQRIFVDSRNLPNWINANDNECVATPYLFDNNGANEVKAYLYSGYEFPVATLQDPGTNKIFGYSGTTRECADCTLRGVNKPPSFWE